MPYFCAVRGCGNTLSRNPNVTIHSFPKRIEQLHYWVQFCEHGDGWIPQKNQGICSKHFCENSYDERYQMRHDLIGAKMRRMLRKDALPGAGLTYEVYREMREDRQISEIDADDVHVHEESTASNFEESNENFKFKLDAAEQKIKIQEQQIASLTQTIQDLKSEIDTDKSVREALQQELHRLHQIIEDLKKANSCLAIRHESETKLLRKQLYDSERKLQLCCTEHVDRTEFVKHMKLVLEGVLSSNQVDIILGRKRCAHWTSEEISKAFALRYLSKRCYLYMKNELNYPLPGISTLQNYAKRINLKNGVLEDVIRTMGIVGQNMRPRDLACIISFDEMAVRKIMEFDQREDEIMGPHTHAQLVMARGLFSNWKQVIFVAFDQPMTISILTDLIQKLHNVNYNFVGITSDNGPENVSLRNKLGITIEKTFFNHPVTQEKIYVFGDAPHNLKLIRNWFVGEGIVWKNQVLNTRLIRKLIEERANCELTPLFALNNGHLELSSAEKQNVSKAAKLLSHTTATALRERFQGTQDADEAKHVADFVETVNDWFDVFNSFNAFDKLAMKQSYRASPHQIAAIDNMLKLIFECRGVKKGKVTCKALAVFQKSIIISIASLKGLFEDMQRIYNIEFISTYKLNQDLLENMISQIRTNGGLDDRPSPLQILHRLRLIILGKNPGITQRNTNTNDQDLQVGQRDEFITAHLFNKADIVPNVPDEFEEYVDECNWIDLSHNSSNGQPCDVYNCHQLEESMSLISVTSDIINTTQEKDGFIYILGWIAFKLRKTHPDLGDKTSNVLNQKHMPAFMSNLSYGGLTVPSPTFQVVGKAMEKIFNLCHGTEDFAFKTNVIETVVNQIMLQYPNFDKTIVKKYVKIRTIVRMRYRNYVEQGLLKPSEAYVAHDDQDNPTRKRTHYSSFGSTEKIIGRPKKIVHKSHIANKYKKISSQ